MSISLEDAKAALVSGNLTVNKIFEIVESVSGKVVGATSESTYLLYSGPMPDGTGTTIIAANIQGAGKGLTVAQSDVGQLLKSKELAIALDQAVRLELFNDPYFLPTSQDQFDAMVARKNLIINGKNGTSAFDPRVANANSLWDIASEKFVAEAHGSFRIIAPQKLDDLSVFVKSELPALLGNPNISTIEGISRTDLLNLKAVTGLKLSSN